MRKKSTQIFLGVVLLVTVSTVSVFSQENDKNDNSSIQTLSKTATLGGYGAPFMMTTSFFDFSRWDFLSGVKGGITFNRIFTLGLVAAGTGSQMRVERNSNGDSKMKRLGLAYSGLFLEYTVMPEKIIHLSSTVEVVGGVMSVGERYYIDPRDDDHDIFWGVIPGVNLDINVAQFFVVGLHAGYRFAFLVDDDNDDDNDDNNDDDSIIDNNRDLWGIQTGLVLRFGKF